MDWLTDFQTKFKDYPELQNLRQSKFHGSIEINFCDGVSMNYNYNLHRRAVKIDNDNLQTTLTQGGKDGESK